MREPEDRLYIYGKHAVTEALKKRADAVRTLFLEEHTNVPLAQMAKRNHIQMKPLDPRQLPGGISSTATHQGCVAVLDRTSLMTPYKKFITGIEVNSEIALLVLGEVQDPHNVGAVIRSAAAFGLAGVLVPPHKQAPVNATVVKVSAGAAFNIPLVEIRNVNATLHDLKERGFWVYGLEGEGGTSLHDEQFKKPTVFVLGNEATGLRVKTRESCDELLSIPMHPRTESLNAAASTAAVLYTWSTQHPKALN